MEIKSINSMSQSLRFSVTKDGREVGRTYIYIIKNDIHKRPYAFIEDVHIEEKYRSKGVGKELMENIYKEAKKMDCYKIVLCCKHTNPKAFKFYERLGYKDMGTKFSMDL